MNIQTLNRHATCGAGSVLDIVIYRRDCILSLWYVHPALAVCSEFGQPNFRMMA